MDSRGKSIPISCPIDYIYDKDGYGAIYRLFSNYNYLDNSNFKNPINQRRVSSNFAAGYCIDRWVWTPNSNGTCSLSADGIAITAPGGTLKQKVISSLSSDYVASIGIVSGNAIAEYDSETQIFTISSETGCTISWAKLENGILPTKWEPKNYVSELYECFRWLVIYDTKYVNNNLLIGNGAGQSTTIAQIVLVLPNTMYSNPSISKSGTITLSDGVNSPSVSNISDPHLSANNLMLTVTGSSIVQNRYYFLRLVNGANIIISCEPDI